MEFRLEPEGLVAKSHYTYEVDYGDGAKETIARNAQFVQHRYKSDGQYRVSVNVLPVAGVPPSAVPIDSITVQVVRMRLSVTPSETEVGVPVWLKATSVSKDRNLRYRFSYGDGKQSSWQDSDEIRHVYSVAGNYTGTAEIAFADTPDPLDSVPSQVITVAAVAPSSVRFFANPTTVKADKPVTFTARFNAKGRQIQYRFVYGDGKESDWQDAPEQTHSYEGKSTDQTYSSYVKVGFLMDGQLYPLVNSDTRTVQVAAVQTPSSPTTPTPTVSEPLPPSIDWVKILAFIALGLLIIGTLIGLTRAVQNRFSKPKPTFVAYADVGAASTIQTSAMPLIDFQLLVDPNLRGGSHQLILGGPVLVRGQRRDP